DSLAPLGAPTTTATHKMTGAAGTAGGDEQLVAVTIYSGSSVGGTVAASATSVAVSAGHWEYVPSNLADGTYTAQATQKDSAGNTGTSAPVTFTIDTQPPTVALDPPPAHSNNVTPSFTGTASETTPVTVTVYLKNVAVASATASGTGAAWTSPPVSPPLKEGKNTYTVSATQTDAAGNS